MKTPLEKLLAEKGHSVFSVNTDATVIDAVHQMNQKKVGALLVVHEGKPIGIFTERDVIQRVLGEGKDPETTKVDEVMTKDIGVVSPSCSVEEAMKIFTEKRCRHLPVMDGENLVGIVSIGDVTKWLTKSQRLEIENLLRYIKGEYPC